MLYFTYTKLQKSNVFIDNSLPDRATREMVTKRRRQRRCETVIDELSAKPVLGPAGGGGRGASAVYVEQQARVGGARDGRRSTAMREWSASASRPAVLSRMASASSLKARSMLMLAFADVSMNLMPCSRAICAQQESTGLSVSIEPLLKSTCYDNRDYLLVI